mmetsp:Transcript_41659/g.81921  ORF Transcript_41659/g.81921 Transcript_41659/m.81921 type:complete len:470 (-) Transcript_41659:205-1614(-)
MYSLRNDSVKAILLIFLFFTSTSILHFTRQHRSKVPTNKNVEGVKRDIENRGICGRPEGAFLSSFIAPAQRNDFKNECSARLKAKWPHEDVSRWTFLAPNDTALPLVVQDAEVIRWESDFLFTTILRPLLNDPMCTEKTTARLLSRSGGIPMEVAKRHVVVGRHYNVLVSGGVYVLNYWKKADSLPFDGNFAKLSEALEVCGVPATLLHLADESAAFNPYLGWPLVIRYYWSPELHKQNGGDQGCLLTLPLGYCGGWHGLPGERPVDQPVPPIIGRAYSWSYIGGWKSSTEKLLSAMRPIRGGYSQTNTRGYMPLSEMHRIMESSTFCPTRVGSVIPDTCRFYEGLESGCLPIVEESMPGANRTRYLSTFYEMWEQQTLPLVRGIRWRQGPRFSDTVHTLSGPWSTATGQVQATLDRIHSGRPPVENEIGAWQSDLLQWWSEIKAGSGLFVRSRICDLQVKSMTPLKNR